MWDIREEIYKKKFIDRVWPAHTLLKEKALNRRMQNPLYYAMVMEAVGEADVTFAGIDNTTGDVGRQMVIGLKPGDQHDLKHRIMRYSEFKGSEGVFLQSATCCVANPDSGQLAGIAVSACDTVRELLGWEPRCAMVSYSTLGSGQGELVIK